MVEITTVAVYRSGQKMNYETFVVAPRGRSPHLQNILHLPGVRAEQKTG